MVVKNFFAQSRRSLTVLSSDKGLGRSRQV